MKKLILICGLALSLLGGGLGIKVLDSSPAYAEPDGNNGDRG